MAPGHPQEHGADVTDDRELSLLDAALRHDAAAQERVEEALERAQRALRRQREGETAAEPLQIPRQSEPG